jgi:hypothetical protein
MGFFSVFGAALAALASVAAAAELKQITNFGPNPSNAKMFLYVILPASFSPSMANADFHIGPR